MHYRYRNTSYQHTLSIHPINTSYQYTLSTHPINTRYQYTLNTHPTSNVFFRTPCNDSSSHCIHISFSFAPCSHYCPPTVSPWLTISPVVICRIWDNTRRSQEPIDPPVHPFPAHLPVNLPIGPLRNQRSSKH